MHIIHNVESIKNYKKILLKGNPKLTEQQIYEILKFIELVAKQTVSNYKNSKVL